MFKFKHYLFFSIKRVLFFVWFDSFLFYNLLNKLYIENIILLQSVKQHSVYKIFPLKYNLFLTFQYIYSTFIKLTEKNVKCYN